MPATQHTELLTLVLGLLVLAFALFEWRRLSRLTAFPWLIAAFLMMVVSWGASVAESFVAGDLLNALQHVSAMLASVCLATWVFSAIATRRRART